MGCDGRQNWPRGPFGAKEIGEGSALPVLDAVARAITTWINELPITPEKIPKAVREQRRKEEWVPV